PRSVVTGRPSALREMVLADLDLDHESNGRLIETHISPAIRLLQELDGNATCIAEVIRYGTPPTEPDVSIVVPLYKRLDLLEQQLAQFALDSDMRGVELIYVLDSPELAGQLKDIARQLHDLYRIAFQIVFLTRNVGFSGANNAVASIATGRLLLLLNSDVFPADKGWVSRMQAFNDLT